MKYHNMLFLFPVLQDIGRIWIGRVRYPICSTESKERVEGQDIRKANLDELSLTKGSLPNDFLNKNFYDSGGMAPKRGRNEFFMAAIDHMDKITKTRSSAIVVNYLPWERVFHHVGCDSEQKKIANYSRLVSPATQTGKNAGRMTQFAIRFGKNRTRLSSKYGGSFAVARWATKVAANMAQGDANRPKSGMGFGSENQLT